MEKKLFDFAIGNPPYQEEQISTDTDSSQKNYAPPVYNFFMDAANTVASKVELIHPARFLFDAGSTPKAWNEKMLNDKHFKVLRYEENSDLIFPALSSPLKGGVAITYRDDAKEFGAIKVYTKFSELNSILHKVTDSNTFVSFSNIVYSRTEYRLTDKMHSDHPEARYVENENHEQIGGLLSKGHDYDMASNIFERIPAIFSDVQPTDGNDYISVMGRSGSKRITKYIRREYVNTTANLDSYKLFVPQANGAGNFGEVNTMPVVAFPGTAHTETFISIGKFASNDECEAGRRYICTKFLRTLLGVLKVTQNGNKPVWRLIPLQDFTSSSDIDWSKSVHEIDLQLYKKYGLSAEEISFIETNVKEMA